MKTCVHRLLGVSINLLSMAQLHSLIEEAVSLNERRIIANHNLNSVYIYHHNSIMRDFYRVADYVHVDGMALIFLGKLLSLPCQRVHRVTYADWVWSLMKEAQKESWRVLYLGSKPGVGDKGASILRNLYPDLQISTLHGYFSLEPNKSENKKVIKQIRAYKPNILMVGMGMPRQEKWILENLDQIETNVILTCGACIDYIAGEVPTPPRWMGKAGLEWLYRLATEPKRLWRRYLIEPWFIVAIFLKEYFSSLKNQFSIVIKNAE